MVENILSLKQASPPTSEGGSFKFQMLHDDGEWCPLRAWKVHWPGSVYGTVRWVVRSPCLAAPAWMGVGTEGGGLVPGSPQACVHAVVCLLSSLSLRSSHL